MIRFLFFLPLLLFPGAGWAAELVVGKWSGSYCFDEDGPLQVEYLVEKRLSAQEPSNISWEITMNAAGVAIPFSIVQLAGAQLSFRMDPGEEVDCLLEAGEGGVFKGQCHSVADPESAQLIRIFMRPPAADSGSGSPLSDAADTEATAPQEPEAIPETEDGPPATDSENSAGQPT